MIVVLAEKPSVGRELAAELGATARCNGYLEGGGYRVTWAIGHLVGLAQPSEIDHAWKAWSRSALPMLPDRFPLRVLNAGAAQYRIVERLLLARDTTSVIAATDAGREGELIFRLIYERAGCTKPWQRLWLSSMTRDAIRRAFEQLKPGSHYDGLANAARARSQADWLVGMNLSRAYTLTNGTLYSVGRVQTPTLALVVRRDREIRTFVPQRYLEVEATFASDKGEYKGIYYVAPPEGLRDERGRLRPFQPAQARLPPDGKLAEAILERVRNVADGVVDAIEQTARRTPPPQLFDLTELQREANRLFGFSAQQTLDAAQSLYEQHKALSYPRTDSRFLSADVAATLPGIVQAIAPSYRELVAPSSGGPLGARWVQDAKVSDHHALIPTTQCPSLPPTSAEARVYDLVCRRLLMAWHPDRVEAVTRLLTRVQGAVGKDADLFATQGVAVEALGWSVLAPRPAGSAAPEPSALPKVPRGLAEDDTVRVVQVQALSKRTQPPKPHTEATLLSAMESAGKHVDDEALREAMRECGLGTPATRAATIETLLGRGYLSRVGKAVTSTQLGEALIDAVHPLVKSPEMTGRWERRLRAMERGGETPVQFMTDIATYVREVVTAEATKPIAAVPSGSTATNRTSRRRRPSTKSTSKPRQHRAKRSAVKS